MLILNVNNIILSFVLIIKVRDPRYTNIFTIFWHFLKVVLIEVSITCMNLCEFMRIRLTDRDYHVIMQRCSQVSTINLGRDLYGSAR